MCAGPGEVVLACRRIQQAANKAAKLHGPTHPCPILSPTPARRTPVWFDGTHKVAIAAADADKLAPARRQDRHGRCVGGTTNSVVGQLSVAIPPLGMGHPWGTHAWAWGTRQWQIEGRHADSSAFRRSKAVPACHPPAHPNTTSGPPGPSRMRAGCPRRWLRTFGCLAARRAWSLPRRRPNRCRPSPLRQRRCGRQLSLTVCTSMTSQAYAEPCATPQPPQKLTPAKRLALDCQGASMVAASRDGRKGETARNGYRGVLPTSHTVAQLAVGAAACTGMRVTRRQVARVHRPAPPLSWSPSHQAANQIPNPFCWRTPTPRIPGSI